jgi:hypothetical protein
VRSISVHVNTVLTRRMAVAPYVCALVNNQTAISLIGKLSGTD